MLEVSVLVVAVVLVIGVPWTIGLVRAIKRQPIKDRLDMYCRR